MISEGQSQRSALLNVEVPPPLAQCARAEGLDVGQAWISTTSDLNLSGQYERIYVLVDDQCLYTLGETTDGRTAVRIRLDRKMVQEVRTRQGVGGGFLEARVEDVFIEVAAYSNARADAFHKLVSKLRRWCADERPPVSVEDDFNPRICPTCGLPLQFKGDVCRNCMKGGAVFRRVLKLMRPYASKAIIMMALVLAAVGLSLVPQFLVRHLVNHVLAPEQAGNAVMTSEAATRTLLWLVGGLLGVYVLTATVQTFSGRLASFVGTQITYDMRSRVFRHLSGLGIDYFDRYNIGQLMTRVAGDTEQMKGFVHQLTSGFLAQLLQVFAVGAVLFTLNWRLAIITLLPAPLVVFSAIFFWRRIYPRYYRIWDANSKLHGVLNTILSGIRVVKAFGQEQRERDRFGRSSGYVRDSFRGVEYIVTAFNPGIGLLFQLGGILVWYYGGGWVLQSHGMPADQRLLNLGDLLAFLGLLGMFYNPLGQLTQLTNWLTGFLTASQRVFEILDTQPQIVETETARPLPQKGGAIVFEHVTFGYHRHEPILRDVSFEVRAGEHIGIVGKSGSGKTTLINLLARFYDVDEGRILIDGVDIRDLKLDELRRYVGIVLQEPLLFRGTIAANVTYGRSSATPEEILAATKAANAHDFIMRHPLGYDTYIGERGAGLSGGERQRASIARALLYDAKILVLDEATSNVDTESEQLIQQALERMTAGRTTLTIAHRLSTLRRSDRIVVLEQGKVTEMGTHAELLALEGMYYRLVKIQTELSAEPSVDAVVARKQMQR